MSEVEPRRRILQLSDFGNGQQWKKFRTPIFQSLNEFPQAFFIFKFGKTGKFVGERLSLRSRSLGAGGQRIFT